MSKICYIIAGPNGAGKTTFAMDLLHEKCSNYINADLIATGLSPFKPEVAAVQAGKLMLSAINKSVDSNQTFAIETTLSGLNYAKKIAKWRSLGYEIVMYYFYLPSVDMAIERVKLRVNRGGHNIPERDIRRRFERSWNNFAYVYKQLVSSWVIYDTSGLVPVLMEESK